MSIAQKFQNFNSNIRISSNDIEKISSRYKTITQRLNLDFYDINSETSHSLYVWSYWRDTDIHVSDIDMLFVLPYSIYERYNNYSWNWQSYLLQAVKDSIKKTYSTTHLKWDWQIIWLNFNDWICFEILPCFINTDDSYTYPDSNNWWKWKTTNPKPEIREIREKNIEWNKNLKRLCRMTRAWKDKWSVPIWWLLIDTLAYNFLKNWWHKEKSYFFYDWMIRDFFEYLKNQDKDKKYWLAVWSNQYVDRKWNFEYKALQCHNLALEAIESEKNWYNYTAISKWNEIFGNKFS